MKFVKFLAHHSSYAAVGTFVGDLSEQIPENLFKVSNI